MVAFLMGFQGEFTNFPCYLCHWDSGDTTGPYQRRIRPKQTEFSVGKSNVKRDPSIDPSKISMPPLHVKLALSNNLLNH